MRKELQLMPQFSETTHKGTQKLYSYIEDHGTQILLFSLIIFALFISINREFSSDEFEAIHTAWKVANGKILYVDFFQNHNPLLYYFLSFFLTVLGAHTYTLYILRFTAFIMFSLCLFFIYSIGKQTFNKNTGIYASILSVPALIAFNGIEIDPDVPMLFFELMSLFFLFLFQKNKKKYFLYLSAFSLALSFLTLQKAVVFIGLIYMYLLYKLFLRKITLKLFALFSVITLATILPYYIYLITAVSQIFEEG